MTRNKKGKKVLLITGASRGIGAATARLAAQRGYTVCVNYNYNQAAAEKVVENIVKQGGEAIAIGADVGSEPDVVQLFQTIDREYGVLHALVNNAGILELQMRLTSMNAARLQRMSTKNGGSGGAIVNVSSKASVLGAANRIVSNG